MPGRCTFTTTRSPVVEHGPVGLADRRGGERLEVERRELLLDGGAELALEHLADLVGRRPGAPTTAAVASSVVSTSGSRSVRVDAIWPNFTNMPPQSSSVSRSRRANSGVASFAARGVVREAALAGVAEDLA